MSVWIPDSEPLLLLVGAEIPIYPDDDGDILYYYDGPLVFFKEMPLPDYKRLLFKAHDQDDQTNHWFYTVLALSEEEEELFVANKIDYYFLFKTSAGERYYIESNGKHAQRIWKVDDFPDDLLPEPGLFLYP